MKGVCEERLNPQSWGVPEFVIRLFARSSAFSSRVCLSGVVVNGLVEVIIIRKSWLVTRRKRLNETTKSMALACPRFPLLKNK